MKHTEIKKLLPSVMQRSMTNNSLPNGIDGNKGSSVLNTFIELMEKMHTPTEDLLDNLHNVFNPRQVPERFLPMLAHWTNLINLFQPDKAGSEPSFWKERTLPTEPGYLRELIAMSVEISQWRGTNYGLKKVLQMATGISNFNIKETDKPFHIQVGVPEEAQKYWELIQRIVEQEKPAHITAEVFIANSEDLDFDYENPENEDEYYEDESEYPDYEDEEQDEDQYYENEDEYYEDQYSEEQGTPTVNKDTRQPSPAKTQPPVDKKPGKSVSKSTNNRKSGKPTAKANKSTESGNQARKPSNRKKPTKPPRK